MHLATVDAEQPAAASAAPQIPVDCGTKYEKVTKLFVQIKICCYLDIIVSIQKPLHIALC